MQASPQTQSNTSDAELRQKLNAAKTTLGIKNLNVNAAASGHVKVMKAVAANPKAQYSQIMNKLSPNERTNYIAATSQVPSDALSSNVPMNRFRRQLQVLKPAATAKKSLMNSYEIIDKEHICEATLRDEVNPPPMLVLKRTGIRIFPDGRRVAMYVNSRMGLTFTIPYSPTGTSTDATIPGVKSEEVEIMESLDQVAKYAQQDNVTSHARHFKFADGSKLKVSHGAAKAIHMVHGALNPENQKKFADMLNTPRGFEKAAHFALSKVQFTIGGK
jgi:hypothetical protein